MGATHIIIAPSDMSKADSISMIDDIKTVSYTHLMTEGVDESDVVKTDGKYIYMVEDGQISITDISKGKPGEETLFRPEMCIRDRNTPAGIAGQNSGCRPDIFS